MRVFSWDCALAVLLPGALVEKLRLKEGDELEVVAARKDETRSRRSTRAPTSRGKSRSHCIVGAQNTSRG